MEAITTLKSLLLAACVTIAATSANAALVGSTSGPDSSYSINFDFGNTGPTSIQSLSIDGSTAAVGTVVWDSIGSIGGTANVSSSSGEDTSIMSFLFSSFGVGDTFSLGGIDPDLSGDASSGVTIGDLIGTTISAMFSDQSTVIGTFVDDPGRDKGLAFEAASVIPLPAGLPLLLGALAAFGMVRRKRGVSKA